MNPLNPYHWFALAAIVVALIFGVHRLDQSRQQIGYDKAKAEYTAAALKAEKAARAKEQALQTQITKAQNDAKIRETKLAADVGRARAATDGLRNDLATARSQLSTLARDALERYTNAQSDVFIDCSRKYTDLAHEADRLSNDRQTLIDGWPQ